MKSIAEITEAMGTNSAMEVGLNSIYSIRPKEEIKMPVKSAEEAFKLANDAEGEMYDIVEELMSHVKGADKRGRIKSRESIERKCRDYGLEVCTLDDLIGKAIIVQTIDDEETVAKLVKEDKHVFRMFDYLNDKNGGGYYAVHANYKLSNGAVAELQIITVRCFVYKEIIGHILYEVRREMLPKAKKDKKYMKTFEKLDEIMEKSYLECRKADKEQTKISQPDLDFTEDELKQIEECVSDKTYMRFEFLLKKKAKSIAPDFISTKDKNLIEHYELDFKHVNKSLREYINDYEKS